MGQKHCIFWLCDWQSFSNPVPSEMLKVSQVWPLPIVLATVSVIGGLCDD
jgi:hypothetical protein